MMTSLDNCRACILITLGLAVATYAYAQNLTMAPVGPFGEHLTDCFVGSFRFVAGGESREYKGNFRGLRASGLPYGDYEALVQCREMNVRSNVRLDRPDEFEVISLGGRIARSDHTQPRLVVQMRNGTTSDDAWWITLTRLYGNGRYEAKFDRDLESAQVSNPEPGTYLVGVLSSGGYECLREIDLVEFTRGWTFDSHTYSFSFDKFAHVVTEADRRDRKQGPWYQEMRKNNEDLWHALEEAPDARTAKETPR